MHADLVVIGAGIVGLTVAFELSESQPDKKIVVVEKESWVACHQTSHNSGVVHEGIYYKPNSKKADLTKLGKILMKEFCQEHNLPIGVPGKLIVATSTQELIGLEKLADMARLNGVSFEILDSNEITRIESRVKGLRAIHSPNTAITDYSAVAEMLYKLLTARGVEFNFNFDLSKMIESDASVLLIAKSGEEIKVSNVLACAGLQADRLAAMSKIKHSLRTIPFRGEYFEVSPDISKKLIYPVPNPKLPFLGVHVTPHINNTSTVGPNAVLAFAREGYSRLSIDAKDSRDTLFFPGFWKLLSRYPGAVAGEIATSISKKFYAAQVSNLISDFDQSELLGNSFSGIRAQLVDRAGQPVDDFLFLSSKRIFHVMNAPSPGATASFAIAKHIVKEFTKGNK